MATAHQGNPTAMSQARPDREGASSDSQSVEITDAQAARNPMLFTALSGAQGLPPGDPGRRQRDILALQRTIGNKAVQRFLDGATRPDRATITDHHIDAHAADHLVGEKVGSGPSLGTTAPRIMRVPTFHHSVQWGTTQPVSGVPTPSIGGSDRSFVDWTVTGKSFMVGVDGPYNQGQFPPNTLERSVNYRAGGHGNVRIEVEIVYALDLRAGSAPIFPARGTFSFYYQWNWESTPDGQVNLQEVPGVQEIVPAPAGGVVRGSGTGSFDPTRRIVMFNAVVLGPQGGPSLLTPPYTTTPARAGSNPPLAHTFTLHLNPVGPVPSAPGPRPIHRDPKVFDASYFIEFPVNRDVPNPGQARQLYEWWRDVVPPWVRDGQADGPIEITVTGRASAPGGEEYNLGLSEQRARHVRQHYLGFVNSEAAQIRFHGEFDRTAPSEQEDPRERHAQVRIVARQSGAAVPGAGTTGSSSASH